MLCSRFPCLCVCVRAGVCARGHLSVSAVFMHDFPSFSKVPHGGDEKAEVADKADGFQPLLPDFFFLFFRDGWD